MGSRRDGRERKSFIKILVALIVLWLTMLYRYMNFANGNEPLEEIYGESLPRLRELKGKWDPEGVFNQWFPIT